MLGVFRKNVGPHYRAYYAVVELPARMILELLEQGIQREAPIASGHLDHLRPARAGGGLLGGAGRAEQQGRRFAGTF